MGTGTTYRLYDFIPPSKFLNDLDAYRSAAVLIFPDKHTSNIACSTQICMLKNVYQL